MSPLIDFHSHFFSRAFFEALAGQSPLSGSTQDKLARVAREAELDVPHPDTSAHLARWIAQLDEYGVGHLVTFASLPEEVPAVAEATAQAEGRLTAFALVNPVAEGAAEKVRGLLREKGFKGILLFPAMHRFDVAGEAARAVLDVVDEHRAIAVVHCGVLQVKLRDLFALPRPYDLSFADPRSLVPAANSFRGVRFVIPHFGAGFFRETLMVGSMCENIYVDTSSSNNWIATQPEQLSLADVFERTLGVFGPERILFGTDSSVFPRGWRRDLFLSQREALGACGVSEAERALVFGGNARRLLDLA